MVEVLHKKWEISMASDRQGFQTIEEGWSNILGDSTAIINLALDVTHHMPIKKHTVKRFRSVKDSRQFYSVVNAHYATRSKTGN